jgi:RNA polymerase sigma-70 factor, ECF subfamily
MHRKEKKPIKSIQSLAIDFVNDRTESSFKTLIERIKPGLHLFVRKYVGNNRDICNEIVSQTFISIWEKIDQYDRIHNFSTWVYAIAKNDALGQLRLGKRNLSHEQLTENQSKTLRMYSGAFYMDLECVGPSGEELTQHLYELTLKEINLLDEPYKTVMVEREVNKKQLQDIADSLEWNLNTVKTRLRKARQEIADNLTKKYPELIEAYNEHEE